MNKSILRKTTSLTALMSFAGMAYTGAIMFFTPHGRIAYWVDWHILGMNKEEFSNVHINLSILFLVSMVLHVWLNWGPIVKYMQNKSGSLVVFTKEMIVATVLATLFFAGTLMNVAPFSNVVEFLADYKDDMADKIGEPPFGHAELATLNGLIWKLKLDKEKSHEALKKAGIKIGDGDTELKMLAKKNNTSPAKIFDIIKDFEKDDDKTVDKENSSDNHVAPAGTGRKTVEKIAEMVGISTADALKKLESAGIKANKDEKLKDIAERAKKMPIELFDIIKAK